MFHLRIARMLNRLSNDAPDQNSQHCDGGGGGSNSDCGGGGSSSDCGSRRDSEAIGEGCAGVASLGVTDQSGVAMAPSKLRSPLGWSMGARHIGGGHAWPHGVFVRSTNGTSATTTNSTNGSSTLISSSGSRQLCARASAKEINQVGFGNAMRQT